MHANVCALHYWLTSGIRHVVLVKIDVFKQFEPAAKADGIANSEEANISLICY